MKIAILSDIHGNSVAMEAVAQEIEKLKIKKIYVLGDMVGYYYHPDKVFSCLEPFDVVFIKGNHEVLLEKAVNDQQVLECIKQKYGSGIKMAIEKLPRKFLEKLWSLPHAVVENLSGINIAFAHGSLENVNQYIYPNADITSFNRILQSGYEYIFLGHTHYPFVFSKSGTVIANVGSVGQARDKGGMASWCVMDLTNQSIVFKHTPYDINTLVEEVKMIDPQNEYLYKVLQR